jgi:hypothetical protein
VLEPTKCENKRATIGIGAEITKESSSFKKLSVHVLLLGSKIFIVTQVGASTNKTTNDPVVLARSVQKLM